MAALSVGPGPDPATRCGPMINAAAVARIDGLVRDAVARGARIVTGGAPLAGPGWFYPPTVLDGVPPDAPLVRGEIFGPVAAVTRFSTEAEAIALANDTEYGLAAYVFAGDPGRGLRIGQAIDCGMIALNRGLLSDPAAPFGGVKQSGLGREGGTGGILEFMEAKYYAVAF